MKIRVSENVLRWSPIPTQINRKTGSFSWKFEAGFENGPNFLKLHLLWIAQYLQAGGMVRTI